MRIEIVVTLAAVFISVALVAGAVASAALSSAAPARKRLRRFGAHRSVAPRSARVQLADAPSERLRRVTKVLPAPSATSASRLRKRMTAAGLDGYGPVVLYSAAQLLLPIASGLAPLAVFGFQHGAVLALLGAALGYALPDLVLSHVTAQYRKSIEDGLPDALDLIVVCVEAGTSLDQAILKASNELEISLPAIARELRIVATETRAGKPRLEAFQDLARRAGVDDVRSLVAMLIQTDRFGTSIAQGLRTHADSSRVKRRQRAEERASTVGVKLVFPLVLCLIPSLYVVCLGPVFVRVYRTLF
jgi:tight adherence protein C